MYRGQLCKVAVGAVFAGAMVWFGVSAVAAAPRCDPVDGNGETFAIAPTQGCVGVFTGEGMITLRDVAYRVEITTCLLEDPIPGDDGTLHAPTSHTFVFFNDVDVEVGSLTTLDKAVLEFLAPPALFRINSNMAITEGTGDFVESFGRMHAHGEIDLAFGYASFDLKGVVCD